MGLSRARAYAKTRGDFSAGVALSRQVKHGPFTRRQRFITIERRSSGLFLVDLNGAI
jgi:hypothetical protein